MPCSCAHRRTRPGVTDGVVARAGTERRGCASEVVALSGRPATVGGGGVGGCGGAGGETAGAARSADCRSTGRLSPPEMAATRAHRRDAVSTALVSARWPQVRTEEPETDM